MWIAKSAILKAKRPYRRWLGATAICICAVLLGFAILPVSAHGQQAGQPGLGTQQPRPLPPWVVNPSANPIPDANDRLNMQAQSAKRASFDAANAERKRQLDSDGAMILKLAAELKAEIDMSPRNTLSLNAMRKAEEIERLAHMVQLKMELTVASN